MKLIVTNKKRFISWIALFAIIVVIILFNMFSSKADTVVADPKNSEEKQNQNVINENNNTNSIKVVLGGDNKNDTNENNTNTTTKNQNTNSQTNTTVSKNNNTTGNNNTNTNKTTNTSAPTGTTKYYIKVNNGAQVVNIYKKDKNGKYTVPVKAMICSTGTQTPKSGVYKIPGRWNWGALFGGVYGQYITAITGNILFHSVPYTKRYDAGSIEYWEYDKLGTKASAGCVRLTVEDAIWIHQNCENGTQVEFYSSSNPGPLGKPTAKKISKAKGDLKNWDPTDPNPDNPWKKSNQSTSKPSNSQQKPTNEVINNQESNTIRNTVTDDKEINNVEGSSNKELGTPIEESKDAKSQETNETMNKEK